MTLKAKNTPILDCRFLATITKSVTVLTVSEGVEALLGFNADDFLTEKVTLQSRIHAQDQDIADVLFSKKTSKTSRTVNIRIRHADGRIRCIKAQYTKVKNPSGKGIFLELLLQDAKSLWQRHGEQTMMDNFKAMMENSDDYIYFKDRNHVFTGASQTLVAITDPSEHWTDLIGQTDYDVFPEAYADIYYELEKQVFFGFYVAHEEQETLDNQGNKGWVDNRKYPLRNEQGELIGLFGMARDITAIKQSEKKLSDSEQRFRGIFENAADAILLINMDGYVRDANPEACRLYGYTYDEFIGKHGRELVHPEHICDFNKSLASTQSNQNHSRESLDFRKDGTTFPIEVHISPFMHLGESVMLCFIRDISERIKTQTELKKSHDEIKATYTELQQIQVQLLQSEKMASVGQLAAGVAHEINNPIGYVYSNLGSLQKYIDDLFKIVDAYEQIEPLLESHLEALANIRSVKANAELGFLKEDVNALMSESREGITRVKTIVQNLKDFSHTGSGEEWQQADLHHGLNSTLNVAWNEIKYKATLNKAYGNLPEVECLPSQLNQVFMNLIVNAAHSIEEKGTITISTGTQGNDVWVEVTDTGSGISSENLSKIFDPFFTTKPVGKGTGLGLSVSYGIMKTHHGNINVISTLGKGSTFRITLPITQPKVMQDA